MGSSSTEKKDEKALPEENGDGLPTDTPVYTSTSTSNMIVKGKETSQNAEDEQMGEHEEHTSEAARANSADSRGEVIKQKENADSASSDENEDDKKQHSDDDDDSSSKSFSKKFRVDSGLLPFPEKLMALLDGDQVSKAMWWLPDGDAFCLIPVLFAEKILDKHFQGTKFESFTRKLNRWGFKRVAGQKVPSNTIAYYNRNFLRGKPKLLKHMNGGKTKFVSAREKRVRAQLKRERDREQAVLIAAQQQALYAEQLGLQGHHHGPGLMPGHISKLPGSTFTANESRLHALLGGRNFVFQQQHQAGNIRVAEQMLAAEQALAAQHREELQMRLLHQGGILPQGMDPAGQLGGLQQLHHGSTVTPMTATSSSDMQQLLAARQMAATNNVFNSGLASQILNGQCMQQSVSVSSANAEDAAAKIAHKRIEEQLKMKRQMSPQQKSGEGASNVNAHMFQLYLLEQQRKERELALHRGQE